MYDTTLLSDYISVNAIYRRSVLPVSGSVIKFHPHHTRGRRAFPSLMAQYPFSATFSSRFVKYFTHLSSPQLWAIGIIVTCDHMLSLFIPTQFCSVGCLLFSKCQYWWRVNNWTSVGLLYQCSYLEYANTAFKFLFFFFLVLE